VNTGREHGQQILTPVFTGRVHGRPFCGPCSRAVFTGRADEPCYAHISFQRFSAAILLAKWTNLTKKKKLLFLATSLSITAYIRRKKKRSCWTRTWLLRRVELSMSSMLVRELSIEDKHEYRSMIRMTEQNFDYLLNLVTPMIRKEDTLIRECISEFSDWSIYRQHGPCTRVPGSHGPCSRPVNTGREHGSCSRPVNRPLVEKKRRQLFHDSDVRSVKFKKQLFQYM